MGSPAFIWPNIFPKQVRPRPKVAWLPYSFGFNGNLPQLLLSAAAYFFTHKLTWNERNPFPYDLYWWRGIDGSRVLAHSFTNPKNGYNARLAAFEVGETWRRFRGKKVHDSTLLAFWLRRRRRRSHPRNARRFAGFALFPDYPTSEWVASPSSTKRFHPIIAGLGREKYLEYHRATFTTKEGSSFFTANCTRPRGRETAATLAALGRQKPYPKEAFRRLWQILLLNEFHDILRAGASTRSTRRPTAKWPRLCKNARISAKRRSLPAKEIKSRIVLRSRGPNLESSVG